MIIVAIFFGKSFGYEWMLVCAKWRRFHSLADVTNFNSYNITFLNIIISEIFNEKLYMQIISISQSDPSRSNLSRSPNRISISTNTRSIVNFSFCLRRDGS